MGRETPEGFRIILRIAAELEMPVIPLAPAFEATIATGADPYRDNIHINWAEQALLADVLFEAVNAD